MNIKIKYYLQTNTFQAVIVTDEVRSYAIFNYEWMGWTTHTEAGGDTTEGQGGVPAFVGFNAGNGTKAYEYRPYSQTTQIRDLPSTGGANGFPGRHIFRIDEKILPGVCIRDLRMFLITLSSHEILFFNFSRRS